MSVFGLIGRSLGHSFSRSYFTDKFKRESLPGHRYELFELAEIGNLRDLIASTPGLRGLNVTIPYKQEVMPLLDVVDPLAAAVGAVNTIAIREGKLMGFNTDVEGFRDTLLPLLPGLIDPDSDIRLRALVLGSGGASRAVGYVLREQGIRFRVVSRSRERGDLSWDMLDPVSLKVCRLLINTTPLGMHPDVGSLPPLPYAAIGPRHTLVDLVYNPPETQFLMFGMERGARTVNGLQMLHAQAEASWRLWNT
ncbi:MAG: shikimate dehydrogenase [Flavobacteriales bacterium]|nr:shikimate dehydrogenase [Flavobacteriales bacterium]